VARERRLVDGDDIARRYIAGESEKALAESLGVDRKVIRKRLVERDVAIRGRSDAMYLRMAQTSAEDRLALTNAAHDAARGTKRSAEAGIRHAIGVERAGTGNASPAELTFAEWLRDAGYETIAQKAIGPYNVDIATSTVAVEILGGGWHRSKHHGKRLRHLLDAGWDVIYIWVDGRRHPLTPRAVEYVIANIEQTKRNPSARRGYWVIRGTGEFVAAGESDGEHIADKLPITSRPDVAPPEVAFGLCHCGCGERTKVSAKSNSRYGWAAGEPRRYLSGHNNQRVAD
jgi:very-short-patch-repair endonuclease